MHRHQQVSSRRLVYPANLVCSRVYSTLWPEEQIALLLRKHLKITGAVLFTEVQTDYRPRTGVGLPAKKERE